jgi:hypothetical protein
MIVHNIPKRPDASPAKKTDAASAHSSPVTTHPLHWQTSSYADQGRGAEFSRFAAQAGAHAGVHVEITRRDLPGRINGPLL